MGWRDESSGGGKISAAEGFIQAPTPLSGAKSQQQSSADACEGHNKAA